MVTKAYTASSSGASGPGEAERGGQPALDRLAGGPVLPVGQVPEVDGIGRVEAGPLERLGRERPRALDQRAVRRERHQPVRHDVVRVQAEQHVREDREVDDRAQLIRGQAAKRHAATVPVERHGRRAVAQRHPAADPRPAGRVVLATARRAHPAQLRVDHRAVIALVVVLGEDLPVRGRVVAVLRDRDQPRWLVRRDDLRRARPAAAARPRRRSRRRAPARATRRPASAAAARRRGRSRAHREIRVRRAARRTARTPRRGRGRRWPSRWPSEPQGSSSWPRCRQVLANARTTPSWPRVSSTPPLPVPTASCAPGAGSWAPRADAHPAAAEEVAPFPLEHGGIGIRGARQHPAFPERPQHLRQFPRIDRSGRVGGQVTWNVALTDHTVKARFQLSPCPALTLTPAGHGACPGAGGTFP